jgi:hypothetical protein
MDSFEPFLLCQIDYNNIITNILKLPPTKNLRPILTDMILNWKSEVGRMTLGSGSGVGMPRYIRPTSSTTMLFGYSQRLVLI